MLAKGGDAWNGWDRRERKPIKAALRPVSVEDITAHPLTPGLLSFGAVKADHYLIGSVIYWTK